MNIITFDHLLKEELYNNVKREFLKDDFKYNDQRSSLSDIRVDIKDNEILVIKERILSTRVEKRNDIDTETGEEIEVEEEIYEVEVEEVTLNFMDDFLLPELEQLSQYYKNSFEKNLHRRNLFSKDGVKGFSEVSLNKLNTRRDQVLKSTHLDQPVKDKLLEVIDDVYEFISNEHYQKSKSIPQKIPLNLNKNEVITLFRLLRENELIPDSLKPPDLSRLIEQNFMFYDSSKNEHVDIKKARKLEQELHGETPDKSVQPTLDALKGRFLDKNFFNI